MRRDIRTWTLAIIITCCAAWVTAAAAAGEPPFDPATISLPGNLVSNPSFESGRPGKGAPDDWTFYAAPQYASLTGEAALHGRHAVLVDRPPLPGIVHVAARQAVPIVPGQEYTLCAWVKVERSNAGVFSLYLDFLDANKQRLAIKQVSQREVTEGWKRLAVTALAPAQAAFAQVLVPYVDGDMRVLTDCVSLTSATGGRPDVRGAISGLTASRLSGSSIYLDWTSPLEHHEVDWRVEGQSRWNTIANVWSAFHNVILLQPQTAYEFQVRGLPPRLIDENGKPAPAAPSLESPVVRAATTKVEPKLWEGLQLWPTQHIASFPDQQCYPCIEFYQGAFYVVEARLYGIHLSRLREQDFAVEWTKQLVPPVKPVSAYQGIPDTCIFQDKLWVMWNRQATGDPKYQIMDSRQLVLQYDLATGQISAPMTIESTKPGCGTWEGGLTVYQGRLWMMWMEVWLNPEGRRRTQIVLRPYEDGRFTETIVFPCPSAYPYGPSINVFGNRMILLWSDLAVGEQRPDFEPLYCTFFDGKDFSPSVQIHGEGRSRYAKGAQLGDDFYCVFKCNSRYPNSGYLYHDLALTRISSDARQIKTTYWVDDVKYNSSPDMIQHGGGLVAVYGKFEHAYGNPRDPALNHGSFIGWIRPDRAPTGN